MIKIRFHKSFVKDYKSLTEDYRIKVNERLKIFMSEPFNSVLNNHSLKGNYKGYRSINISGDLRAIYSIEDDDIALFVAIGSNSKLYK